MWAITNLRISKLAHLESFDWELYNKVLTWSFWFKLKKI